MAIPGGPQGVPHWISPSGEKGNSSKHNYRPSVHCGMLPYVLSYVLWSDICPVNP